MRLLEPYFLYAFLALAIPIIIHLFSLRRPRVTYFSNVAFLKQIQEKKTHINHLQKRLLLLIRLLALSALIMAFCEPYIASTTIEEKQHKIIGIYVDNSFSMEAENDRGILIEQAKNKARSVLNAHKDKDKFIFISNELQGKHQRVIDANDCLKAIDQTQVKPQVLSLASILNRWSSLKQNESSSKADLYLISDFQKSNFTHELFIRDSTFTTHLIPIKSYPQSNLSIDSCYLKSPNHFVGQQEELTCALTNASDENLENLSLKLNINGTTKALTNFNVGANESTTALLQFQNQSVGTKKSIVELSDASIQFDNRLFFNYSVIESSSVLCIFEGEIDNTLKKVFADEVFTYSETEVGRLNLSDIHKQNLVILNEVFKPTSGLIARLKSYVNNGGNLLIIPPTNIETVAYKQLSEELKISEYANFIEQEFQITDINQEHTIFHDVFEDETKVYQLPKALQHFQLKPILTSRRESIMQLSSGNTFLESYTSKNGLIYQTSTPLNKTSSNFHEHALFVPTLYNMAMKKSFSAPLYHTLGQTRFITVDGSYNKNNWRLHKDSIDFIPETISKSNKTQIGLQNLIQEVGFFSLKNEEKIETLSFNHNRSESQMQMWEIEELKKLTHNFNQLKIWEKEGLILENTLKEQRSGFSLWQSFIFLALILLITESFLLKNWKKKSNENLNNETTH